MPHEHPTPATYSHVSGFIGTFDKGNLYHMLNGFSDQIEK